MTRTAEWGQMIHNDLDGLRNDLMQRRGQGGILPVIEGHEWDTEGFKVCVLTTYFHK